MHLGSRQKISCKDLGSRQIMLMFCVTNYKLSTSQILQIGNQTLKTDTLPSLQI